MASQAISRLRAAWAACGGIYHQKLKVQQHPSEMHSARCDFAQAGGFSAHSRFFSAKAAVKDPASVAAAAAGSAGEAAAVKKKRRKRKNFMEIAQYLPDWGLGVKFKKSHWPESNFYRVTKVKVYKSGRHGGAWGVFHQDGVEKTGQIQKIGGVNKRCWRYIPEHESVGVGWKQILPKSSDPPKPIPVNNAEDATLP